MFEKFTPKGIFTPCLNSQILNNKQKEKFMKGKTYEIMNFCADFNFANLENIAIAMLTYENENLIIILLVQKGNEQLGIELKNDYFNVFGTLLYVFEMSSWNNKSGFYTMIKFKE